MCAGDNKPFTAVTLYAVTGCCAAEGHLAPRSLTLFGSEQADQFSVMGAVDLSTAGR